MRPRPRCRVDPGSIPETELAQAFGTFVDQHHEGFARDVKGYATVGVWMIKLAFGLVQFRASSNTQ